MKIYTKTGDKGETSLIGGTRVKKSHIRIESYGTVDELNSWIGLLSIQEVNKTRTAVLQQIQERLFTIGSSLAADPNKSTMALPDLEEADINILESEIDEMNLELPELRNFILPGGGQEASFCHIARCVCRRAERNIVALQEESPVEDLLVKYLNRLSDYLFVLARKMSQELHQEEITWIPRKK